MWSKTPFKSRQPTDNSTVAGTTSGIHMSFADHPLTHHEPSGPASGTNATAALPLAKNNHEDKLEDSSVSPAISPELGPRARDSAGSFSVSSLGDDDLRSEYFQDAFSAPNHKLGAPVPAPTVSSRPSREKLAHEAPLPTQFPSTTPTRNVPTGVQANGSVKSIAGWQGQARPRHQGFHKPSGSHATNLLNWGREQLQPKKKHEQGRSRIPSRSRNEPDSSQYGSRSAAQSMPFVQHARRDTFSPPQDANLGFVPTVVTTITAGPSKSYPAKQVTESTSKASSPRLEPLPIIDTAEGFLLSTEAETDTPQPAVSVTAMDAADDNPRRNHSSHERDIGESEVTDDRADSIMSRRRPVPIAMPPTSKKPVRKPIAPKASPTSTIAAQTVSSDAPKDTLGRIEVLEARRDELAKRRFNLETVIRELTRVIQPTSTVYDLAAKAEVKRSVQSIENEIAEIKREEHELGLKVTRAWRRLDERENNGDGSNLWVKRVTS
ncbi:hypothetical protein PDE_04725 [Penicillium oxalicum 114-2]|uniref:BHLH domain-containing protein n=1 Tax=Penicillium oxalicum (strain 114-2 / CGMCC 5302) TaxID=933388 RepID=S7ZGF9_PENO1|nr:hypothetical protein PDE_04725 [Penicillium oxalicum 114-2]